jgi:calreticulin
LLTSTPPLPHQDPEAKKPEDWDEREKIPDPADKKPDGHDDIPATIPDKDAKKPDDWSDEDDGEGLLTLCYSCNLPAY